MHLDSRIDRVSERARCGVVINVGDALLPFASANEELAGIEYVGDARHMRCPCHVCRVDGGHPDTSQGLAGGR